MLISLLKKHAYPRTCDWFIDNFMQVMCILVLYQNYPCILAHTNTRAPQHTAGCSYYQVPTEGSVFENQVLRSHCKEKEAQQSFLPAREVSRERWKKKNQPKYALEMCLVGGCHLLAPGTSPRRGTSPRLLGQVFPPFSWHPASEFCLPCARAFRKAMHISEWHYFI